MKFTMVLKVFGLVLAGFVGLFATLLTYLFATGGFNPPYIPPELISFEYDEYIIDDDTEIFIFPTPEDATELDVELSVTLGKDTIITLPETGKMTEPILVEVIKDEFGKNVGGVAKIRASHGGLLLDETTILVDVPVESFELSPTLEGNIYVGNTFIVEPVDEYPLNSLNPSNVNFPKQDKVIRYYSSNPNVATVDELTGEVITLSEGVFTIEARVIKTYNLVETQPNPLDFEYEEDYWAAMDEISVIAQKEFTVSSIAVAGIETNDNEEDPLYELYLYDEYMDENEAPFIPFTPSDFGLKLLPQPDSSFTPEQLNYKLSDLTIWVSNENVLEVTPLYEPLRYQIRVLNFETWQIHKTRIVFIYEDEYNHFEASVHFKILRNDVEEIEIATNAPGAIEVLLKEQNSQTFDLEANTTIVAQVEEVAPTYSKLIYQIDLTAAKNEFGEDIILYESETGYIWYETELGERIENVIVPQNRGTTRLKALIVETDINGTAILDEFGNYIIMFEMPEYVTVNVLEQLTNIKPVTFKKPKLIGANVGEVLHITANSLTPEQLNSYSEGTLTFVVSNNTMLQLDRYELNENNVTAVYNVLLSGAVNVFIMDTTTQMFIDYVEVNITTNTASLDPVLYEFNLNKTLEITPPPTEENPDPGPIISMIRGTESFLTFEPNSYGAFVDSYRYGKLIIQSVNTNIIQVYTQIDENNNILVKLYAVGFDLNPENSFSMIQIRLIDAPPNIFLLNERVTVDLGAVNNIHLNVNSTQINAIPEVGGTQWRTPEGEQLTPTVTFSDPEEPAITGVQFASSDTSILEIDDSQLNENGVPRFVFKKAGVVNLIVYSLDEFANGGLGASDFVTLYVTTPPVVENFVYSNLVDEEEVSNYTQVLAGEQIDLFNELIGTETVQHIKIERSNGTDYTPLAQFELLGIEGAASLQDIPANELLQTQRQLLLTTYEVGERITLNIRIYTDFGYESTYEVRIVPNINENNITYKGGESPEVVYPLTTGNKEIRLLQEQDGVTRVVVTKKDGSSLSQPLQFELSDLNASMLSATETGTILVWQTSVVRQVQVRIFIDFASGIPFERFYNLEIRPNIQINFDYSNPVEHEQQWYEQIDYAPTYNLIANGKVSASTIEPPAQDITSELNFVKSSGLSIIQVERTTGIITISEPLLEDAYVVIRVYTIYGYEQIYRIKIKATP